MPIFVYRCPDCGVEVERLVARDAADPQCVGCESTMKKVLQPFSMDLRGPGFFATEHPDVDKVVGAKAEEAKEFVKKREEGKKSIAEEGKSVIRTEDGSTYYTTDKKLVGDYSKSRSTLMDSLDRNT